MSVVVPGQVVYSRFTVSETPDSLPTVSVYKSTALGVESDATALVAASVAVVSGLAYRVAYTIEAGALHGDTYSPLVSVIIGGASESRWVSADVVDTKVDRIPIDGDGVLTAGQQASLDAIEDKTALIGTGNITWTSPADADGDIIVRRDRDYHNTDGLDVEFANVDGTWADLTGATVTMLVARPGQVMADHSFAMSVVTPTGANQLVRLELTAVQLAIEANDYVGEVVAVLASGRKVTLTEGSFEVLLGREAPV